MKRGAARARPVSCPRCGYDFWGMVETWAEACPIAGRCAECGLAFEWGELLSLRRAVPRWCVEYARGWAVWPTAFKTLLVLFFRPRKFWRDLKMVHEPRWRRFPACVFMALAVLYLAFAVDVGYSIFRHYQREATWLPPSTFPDPLLMGLYAAVIPFSDFSVTVRMSGGNWTSRTPRSYALRCNPLPMLRHISAAVRSNHFANPWNLHLYSSGRHSILLAHSVMLAFLNPFAFLVLPQSLKRAKVRSRHLVRIWLYSLFFLVPPILLVMHDQMRGWGSWRMNELSSFVVFLLPASCLVIWWSLAAKHYLKLPHAWAVGVSMVVLAYASGLFIISLVDYLLI